MQEFRYRPALLGFVGLATGIFITQSGIAIDLLIIASIAILIAVLALFLEQSVRPFALLVGASFLGMLLGGIDHTEFQHQPLATLAGFKIDQVGLTGTIAEEAQTEFGLFYVMDVESVFVDARTIPMHGRVAVWYSGEITGNVLPHFTERAMMYVTLEPLGARRNPYEFPADDHLARIYSIVAKATLHDEFDSYPLQRRTELTAKERLRLYCIAATEWIDRQLAIAIPDKPTLAFIRAVVLGERTEMSHTQLQEFNRAGVSHILAVSGFNVAIVSLVVTHLLRILGLGRRGIRLALSMIAVLIYCTLVGFQPSVLRAFLMIEFLFAAMLLERKPDPLNIVMSAAIITLVILPSFLFDVGFQLSYAAVAGLAVIYVWFKRVLIDPMARDGRPHWLIRLTEAFTVSLAATIATLPVTVAQFHRVSLVGLFVNLIAIPLSSVLTAAGFLLIPVTALSPWLGKLYGEATTWATQLLFLLTHISSGFELAAVNVQSLPYWVSLSFVMALVYLVGARTGMDAVRRTSIVLVGALAFAFVAPPLESTSLLPVGKLTLVAFDVGQGDCLFLRTPRGKSYLIDFGANSRNGGTAQFERCVEPCLVAEGIHEVNTGFISHMHLDHYGGAESAISALTIRSIATSGERVDNPQSRTLDRIVRDRQISTRVMVRGDQMMLDSDVRLYVLHPSGASVSRGGRYGLQLNDGSLGLLVMYGKTRMLFLGDMESSDEERLMEEYGPMLRCDVVKVAHHGSMTSSSRAFVEAVSPKYAVISVGEHNRFGHPEPAIVRRWMTSGAEVMRTDRDGAIVIQTDGAHVTQAAWR